MASLRDSRPKPRSQARRPNYPAAWACDAMMLIAACGGKVEQAAGEDTGGSGGDTYTPMPSGAGTGGSYDPGVGGTGGGATGGAAGYDPGMPTGAGAGGSYEPDPDAGPIDYDAGPSGVADAPYEPDVPDAAMPVDGGVMADPCVQSCAEGDPEAWQLMFDQLGPCTCQSACTAECADTICLGPGESPSDGCADCALRAAMDSCVEALATCLSDEACAPVVVCLLGCEP